MGNLTQDQNKKTLHRSAFSALTQYKALKAEKVAVKAAINATKKPIASDIVATDYNALDMFDSMLVINMTRSDFRNLGENLEKLKDINTKIPALKTYLQDAITFLDVQEYIDEINAEIA